MKTQKNIVDKKFKKYEVINEIKALWAKQDNWRIKNNIKSKLKTKWINGEYRFCLMVYFSKADKKLEEKLFNKFHKHVGRAIEIKYKNIYLWYGGDESYAIIDADRLPAEEEKKLKEVNWVLVSQCHGDCYRTRLERYKKVYRVISEDYNGWAPYGYTVGPGWWDSEVEYYGAKRGAYLLFWGL